MELSLEQIQEKVNGYVNNYAVALFNILEKEISIQVDWDSITESSNPQRAAEALFSWQGYFVFGRLIEVIQEYAIKYEGKSDIQQLLDAIVVQNISKGKKVEMNGTTLLVKSNFTKGSLGAIKKKRLKKLIGGLFRLTMKSYMKLIEDECIPRAIKELNDCLEFDNNETMEFVVDWDSFKRSTDIAEALSNLTYSRGWYSFSNVSRAFRYGVQYDELSKKKLKALVKKVEFIHIPGKGYNKKKAFLEGTTLKIYGQWESWWGGNLRTYDIQSLLRHSVKLFKLEKKLKKNKFGKEQKKKKIRLLKDVSESFYIRKGHFEYLESILSSPVFLKPDKLDEKAFEIFMTKYVNKEKKKKEKEKKTEKKDKKEKLLYGYPIKKVNHRGSKQDRMLVITDKAMYTFGYKYKKKKVVEKTIHKFKHSEWWYCQFGELGTSGGFGTELAKAAGGEELEKVSEGVGEIAEVISGKEEYGVRFVTSKRRKKPNPVLKKLAAKLGKKILMVFDKLVENQIDGREGLPEIDIPENPKFELDDIFKIVAKSLSKEKGELPFVQIGEYPPASILDIMVVLEEIWDGVSNQPKLKLPNLPVINVGWLLKNCLSVLKEMDDLELEFPEQPSLSIFFKNILRDLEEKGEEALDEIELPSPNPIPLSDLLSIIVESLENHDEKLPKMKFSGFKLPKMNKVLETCIKSSQNVPEINFPAPKKLKILKVLKIINEVIGSIDLPSVSVGDLGIDFGIELPSLSLPDIDLGVDMPGGGKFLKYLKPKAKPPYAGLMYYPNGKPEKYLCKEMSYVHRALAMCNNTPSWVSRPYKTKINYQATTFGQFLNKTGKHKSKKPEKKDKKKKDKKKDKNKDEKTEKNEEEKQEEKQEEEQEEEKQEEEKQEENKNNEEEN
ncbi:stress response protein nst1 [Anaeramoeba flamelloides]|uniref:Stress response protein nst1 n=1 Tax=Anaeramoeba flamelloides TaxID=1746091 RepID=A0AAV8ACM2_9EUKA|nr:stress response protein nst1 [Anaeramoeba flamelloides]